MTLVQMQRGPAGVTPVHGTAADAIDTAGPRVGDDMTVEVALSVMAGARTEHLLVCDDDGLCTGLVTRARLVAVRDGSAYTDRVQLRDLPDLRGPLTSPVSARAEGEEGSAADVLVLAR
ncbi:CBS domain-containing protein [Streptomyces alboniger]|uniref:CBS domain-containing protein n=1 Tax=Streptomyces alboniger TaxID=132473 RepID=A0A5J6HHZ9_STRAD|nr:CBS domain-containing protein [Streptomyces alboniger]QEV19949.1 CBS domain-containing protein [Streptomyces alboniger]